MRLQSSRLSLSLGALAAGVLAVAAVAGLPGGAAPAGAATTTVNIGSGFTFSPPAVTIHVGDTVTWQHDSSATMHTVTADDGSFDSSPSCPATPSNCLGANASFSHTFTTAGTFRYYCKIHGGPGGAGMSGTVTVLAAPPTTTPPTTTPGAPTTSPQPAGGTPSASSTGGTAAPAATPSASLPRTGSSSVPLLLAGAAAIALGALAVATRRRVRPTR